VFEDLKTEISQSPNVSLVCTTSLQLGLGATFLKPATSILLKSSQPDNESMYVKTIKSL